MSVSLAVTIVLLLACAGIAASEANTAVTASDTGADKAAETPKQKKVETATFAMG